MPKILITGAYGQLGSELEELVNNSTTLKTVDFLFTDKESLDITDEHILQNYIADKSITHIINCAAYTAVDKAESDEINADKINHLSVKYLATIAKEKSLPFIHVSTDYVFDGTNHVPYIETDAVSPNGVYGRTKLAGEEALLEINPKHSIIIRTSWVYSSYGANFVKTMLKLGEERDSLGVIFDQVGTPTYAKDLAQTILTILPKLSNDNVEIYHYSNEGVCSWYDFATAIFKISNIECKVSPIETKEYPTPATRPSYSLLNKAKIKKDFHLVIPHWEKSLNQCLKTLDN